MLSKKTFFTAALIGWVVACSIKEASEFSGHLAAEATLKAEGMRNPAPEFALKDADGKNVNLADYRGKVVLLNFWATWCPPCKVEIPWFIEFEKRYKAEGLAVLGVSLDEEGWKVVKPYLEHSRINYRILMADATIEQTYGPIEALPTSFIIDQKGRIAAVHVGLAERSNYEGQIVELLHAAGSAGLTASAAN